MAQRLIVRDRDTVMNGIIEACEDIIDKVDSLVGDIKGTTKMTIAITIDPMSLISYEVTRTQIPTFKKEEKTHD